LQFTGILSNQNLSLLFAGLIEKITEQHPQKTVFAVYKDLKFFTDFKIYAFKSDLHVFFMHHMNLSVLIL